MYKLPGQEELLFYMLYTTAAVLSLIACCYLLFRRANAIAPDITSPVRLRRWTAVFFAALTLSHLWYLPSVFLSSVDDILLCNSIGALLDCMIVYPLMIVVLPQATTVACSCDGVTTRCWHSGVHCQPERYPSANVTYLYSAVGHRLNNIYGSRGQTLWTLVA